jgi:hypothetical protein
VRTALLLVAFAVGAVCLRAADEDTKPITAAHFLGKTIRVRGCVMKFEERPYLPVHDPDQITVVEKK